MQGVNSLVGDMPMYVGDLEPNAPVERNQRGFANLIPGRRDVVTDGTEWVVAIMVLGSLIFLISLRAGGFQSVIAAR